MLTLASTARSYVSIALRQTLFILTHIIADQV